MNLLSIPLVRELIILVLVMTGNIAFGVALSELQQKFDMVTFKKGLFKGTVVTIGIALFSFVSYLENGLTIAFNGGQYSLNDAMYLIIWTAVIAYSADGIQKLAKIFNFKSQEGTK